MKFSSFVLISLFFLSVAPNVNSQSRSQELTESLRQSLEEQFRSSTGLGFAEFQCDLPPDSPPGRELTCQAVDEDGDHFSYRIIFKEQRQPPSVTTTQPIDS